MKQRCLHTYNIAYQYYGAKGVTICEDGWTGIERELSEQDVNGVYETLKWLKENYNPPIRK